jgi:hypothetical protein
MQVSAQTDIMAVPNDMPSGEGNLNAAVQAAIAEGNLSNTVLKLEPDGCYILTGTITVLAGEQSDHHCTGAGDDANDSPATDCLDIKQRCK